MSSPPLTRDSPSSSGCFKTDILTAGITRRHLFVIQLLYNQHKVFKVHLKLLLRRSPGASSNVANIIFLRDHQTHDTPRKQCTVILPITDSQLWWISCERSQNNWPNCPLVVGSSSGNRPPPTHMQVHTPIRSRANSFSFQHILGFFSHYFLPHSSVHKCVYVLYI